MNPSSGSMKILFLDKVLLKPRKTRVPLRGVELFNLFLVRDLVEAGLEVTLAAERSWAGDIREVAGRRPLQVAWLPHTGLDFLNGLIGALKLSRRRFDVLLMGNVGSSLLPALSVLRCAGAFNRGVLIAHREAGARFVRAVRSLPGHVLAVNGVIAEPFRRSGGPPVSVDYGIMNAEKFFPRANPKAPTEPVVFGVLGALDNVWKGADTAVAAFRRLPEDVRRRCRLQLISYAQPPVFPEPNIEALPWLESGRIPDLLRELDVLLVPSRDEEVMRETFSQAMVQGMLTGLPIIAHRLPVLAEKLVEGGGRLFASESELVQALTELAGNPELRRRLGEQARQTARARYTWDSQRFIDRYLRS